MKINTPMIVGMGAALVLIIILVLVVSDEGGDEIVEEEEGSSETDMNTDVDNLGSFDPSFEEPGLDVYEDTHEDSQEEHEQHMVQAQGPETPLCDDFQCPDNLEVNTGFRGDTQDACCVLPECTSDTCNPLEFKKPIPGARGDTPEQCCRDALCTADMCEDGYFLKPDADKGFNSSDCCQQKPLCSTSFTCDGEYEDKAGPPIPRGSTRDECCNVQLCSVNGYNDAMCNNVGMKAKVGAVRGKSVGECCEMDTCKNNEVRHDTATHEFKFENSGECPNGTSFDFTPNDQLGNTLATCCSMSSCTDNGWDDGECKFASGNQKTLKYGNPRGDSVNECCDEKTCDNNYYFDTRSTCIDGGPAGEPSEPGMSSPCYHMGNTNQEYQSLPEVDIAGEDRRRPNTHAAAFGDMKKNCAYFNMKMTPRGTKMPFDTTKNTETCCQPLSCKEYSENPESGISEECPTNDEGKPGVFLPDKVIPVSELDIDTNTLIYEPRQEQCCEAAKCSEVYSDQKCSDKFDEMQEAGPADFTHPFTVGGVEIPISSGGYLKYNSTNDDEGSSIEKCCKPKKCNEVNFVCPDTMIKKPTQPTDVVSDNNCCTPKTCANSPFTCPANRPSKSTAPTTGEWNVENCCEPIRCNEVGWTEAKCKDRAFTRAAYRGKMKRDPNDATKYASTGSLGDGARARPGGAPPNHHVAGMNAGDKQCCEQSKDNFARQCVGEMWTAGRLENGSVGADSTEHLVQIGSRHTGKTPDQCKALCAADANCTTFKSSAHTGTGKNNGGSTASPNCDLYKAFPTSGSGDIQYKVAGEYSAAPVHTQYVSNDTFPETVRYSGGRLQTIAEVKAASHSPTKPGYDGSAKWHGKENVYLAGVDKEFCPYRYVKGFGIFNDGAHGSHYYGGTWHDQNKAADDPFKGRKLNYVNKAGTEFANTSGEKCYGQHSYGLNASTSWQQSTQHVTHMATTPFYPSESLDACYNEDHCHWLWMQPHGHVAGTADSGLPYQTRWDPAVAYINRRTAKSTSGKRCSVEGSSNGLTDAQVSRRVCMKGGPNKQTTLEPTYIPSGGASLYMTRNKLETTGSGTSRTGKYRVGTMPYKIKFATRHWYSGPENWSPLLISGDNTDQPSF